MWRSIVTIVAMSLLSFGQGGTSPTGGARGVQDETCWEDGGANVTSVDIGQGGTSAEFTNENGDSAGPVSGRPAANGGMAHSNPHAPSFPDGTKARIRGGIVQTKAPGGSWKNNTRTSCSTPVARREGVGTLPNVGIDTGTVSDL